MKQPMTREQFKALPLGRKITVLTGHYFWHVLLASMLLVVVGTWIKEDFIDPETVMGVEMINACTQSPEGEAFQPALRQAGYCTGDQQVKVSKAYQLEDGPEAMKRNPHAMFFCTLQAKKTDLFFWDTHVFDMEFRQGALIDLREVLPKELLEKYQDNLVFTGLRMHGGYPCGIYLEDNDWVQEHHYYDTCTVGIAKDAQNMEEAVAFLTYILQ